MDNNTTNEVKIAGIDLRRLLSDGLGALRRTLLPFLGLLVLLVGLLCLREYRSYRPMYRASATFTVNVTNPLQSEIRSYNTATAEQMAKTFPYILTSGALNERVMQELNISAMPAVSATVLSNTNIFTLAVSSGDPQLAYDVLNAVITDYPDVAEFVVGPTVMTLLDESGLPKSPYNTRDYTHAVKQGVLIWLVLWLVVALCMASLRTTVHSEQELKQILNLRVISALPVVRGRKKKERALSPRMDDSASHSGFSESVRLMRIRAEKEMKEQNIKTLLISSATPGEGKTTIAINLADALAEAGSRVLLIDCDLRSPSVARALNRENEVGLSEYLKGETTYQHIIQRSDNQNLFLIFAGRPVSDASELFAKPECRQFLEAPGLGTSEQFHSGRDPLLHGALGGTDTGVGTGMEVVFLQIHLAHKPPADHSGGQGALYIDKAPAMGLEQAFVQVFFHILMAGFNPLLPGSLTQQCLGEDHMIGGGCVSYEIPYARPVFRLRGILIAGHAGPLGHGTFFRD